MKLTFKTSGTVEKIFTTAERVNGDEINTLKVQLYTLDGPVIVVTKFITTELFLNLKNEIELGEVIEVSGEYYPAASNDEDPLFHGINYKVNNTSINLDKKE